ncbi:COPII-coated vesicle component Erp2/3/4 [Schizosaccharomyces japonicus yFS275]|uniref:COPII-coated vesicle component Erp2/3/4 n=1 Tax=Schizosaccharomyces japonicus (strain yFS275 / FY16936) TaxID=402676 RepID=B6K3S9_SCHJY|nr:COPII-coated vesicle component Erp2/3/4 [Schizosaccharomyces japonicus yFS275]EEB08136.1 COPII-coated vesicle component Erp2/3/4 [Schizosaccharomyces japonicus yFS275]
MLVLFTLLSALFALVRASELTFKLENQDTQCFSVDAIHLGEKCHFTYAVQSGGAFDVNYEIQSPAGKTIVQGKRKQQADVYFTLEERGEYQFCFDNHISAFTDKIITLEITLENELSIKPHGQEEKHQHESGSREALVMELSSDLMEISRYQTYFRTRENRNFSTVKSTESRILYFALGESLMVIGISALQVFIVKTFFKRRGKQSV